MRILCVHLGNVAVECWNFIILEKGKGITANKQHNAYILPLLALKTYHIHSIFTETHKIHEPHQHSDDGVPLNCSTSTLEHTLLNHRHENRRWNGDINSKWIFFTCEVWSVHGHCFLCPHNDNKIINILCSNVNLLFYTWMFYD